MSQPGDYSVGHTPTEATIEEPERSILESELDDFQQVLNSLEQLPTPCAREVVCSAIDYDAKTVDQDQLYSHV